MNLSMVNSETSLNEQESSVWNQRLQALNYAQKKPLLSGKIKLEPRDFIVTELMDVVPSGQGEHYWLDITKEQCNTDAIAKQLAKFSNVAYRDVGYSGLKDFNAQTRQWFSVWKPKGGEPDWGAFKIAGVQINQITKHNRKIRRGTHRANQFEINVSELCGERECLESRLENIAKQGVPNYFGVQRFGRNADNMNKAVSFFNGELQIKNRNLKSIVLSSARSWLFNEVVSARVGAANWQTLCENEPANLNGSNSVFFSQGNLEESQRLIDHDIHPTAPMWGEGAAKFMDQCTELANWESEILDSYKELQSGLENARLEYQRRALRCSVRNLRWQLGESELLLSFELQRGQFATSVLRELVNV